MSVRNQISNIFYDYASEILIGIMALPLGFALQAVAEASNVSIQNANIVNMIKTDVFQLGPTPFWSTIAITLLFLGTVIVLLAHTHSSRELQYPTYRIVALALVVIMVEYNLIAISGFLPKMSGDESTSSLIVTPLEHPLFTHHASSLIVPFLAAYYLLIRWDSDRDPGPVKNAMVILSSFYVVYFVFFPS